MGVDPSNLLISGLAASPLAGVAKSVIQDAVKTAIVNRLKPEPLEHAISDVVEEFQSRLQGDLTPILTAWTRDTYFVEDVMSVFDSGAEESECVEVSFDSFTHEPYFAPAGTRFPSLAREILFAFFAHLRTWTLRSRDGTEYLFLRLSGYLDALAEQQKAALMQERRLAEVVEQLVPVVLEMGEQGPRSGDLRKVLEAMDAERQSWALEDYFRALRQYLAHPPYLGVHIDSTSNPELEKFNWYVPLTFKSSVEGVGDDKGSFTNDAGPLPVSALTGLATGPEPTHTVFVQGRPGSGKSSLMRYIAGHAWDSPADVGLSKRFLPMVIRMRWLAASDDSIETRMRLALKQAGELAMEADPPAGFFHEWPRLTQAPWLLLIDGLEEIAGAEEQPRTRALIRWFLTLRDVVEERGGRIIIMGRDVETLRLPDLGRAVAVYSVLPFSHSQSRQMLETLVPAKTDIVMKQLEREGLVGVLDNPLMLAVAAELYIRGKRIGGVSRDVLYHRFIATLLNESKAHGLEEELGESSNVALQCLQTVALEMTRRPELHSIDDLSEVASAYLRGALRVTPDVADGLGRRFLEVMARRSGLLSKKGETLEWLHPTFREFLAAEHLVRQHRGPALEGSKFALDHVVVPRWSGVVEFLVELWEHGGKDVRGLRVQLADRRSRAVSQTSHGAVEQVSKSGVVPKISFRLEPADISLLRELAAQGRPSVTEALRSAIAIEHFLSSAMSKGERVFIQDQAGNMRQIVR